MPLQSAVRPSAVSWWAYGPVSASQEISHPSNEGLLVQVHSNEGRMTARGSDGRFTAPRASMAEGEGMPEPSRGIAESAQRRVTERAQQLRRLADIVRDPKTPAATAVRASIQWSNLMGENAPKVEREQRTSTVVEPGIEGMTREERQAERERLLRERGGPAPATNEPPAEEKSGEPQTDTNPPINLLVQRGPGQIVSTMPYPPVVSTNEPLDADESPDLLVQVFDGAIVSTKE